MDWICHLTFLGVKKEGRKLNKLFYQHHEEIEGGGGVFCYPLRISKTLALLNIHTYSTVQTW